VLKFRHLLGHYLGNFGWRHVALYASNGMYEEALWCVEGEVYASF
jgi:hypothetical protein